LKKITTSHARLSQFKAELGGDSPFGVSPDATSGICLIYVAWGKIHTFKTTFRENDFE
jgi:hypothetical protein